MGAPASRSKLQRASVFSAQAPVEIDSGDALDITIPHSLEPETPDGNVICTPEVNWTPDFLDASGSDAAVVALYNELLVEMETKQEDANGSVATNWNSAAVMERELILDSNKDQKGISPSSLPLEQRLLSAAAWLGRADCVDE